MAPVYGRSLRAVLLAYDDDTAYVTRLRNAEIEFGRDTIDVTTLGSPVPRMVPGMVRRLSINGEPDGLVVQDQGSVFSPHDFHVAADQLEELGWGGPVVALLRTLGGDALPDGIFMPGTETRG